MSDAVSPINGAAPLLSIRNLSKSFGGARALDGVDLDVAPGEVHGLLGTNGSGKSTLVKVLSGFHAPDPGVELTLKGRRVHLPLRAGAFRHLGLSFVHQNLGLIPTLSVLENLRIAALLEANPWRIDWAAQRTAARAALDKFGLDIRLDQPVAELSPVDRALLAIVRAFEDLTLSSDSGPGVLLLDEPTPFLPAAGVKTLFSLVRQIVEHGSSVIFISHDIDEILEITDRVTVLRDGRVAGHQVTRDSRHADIVELIIGRKLEPMTRAEAPVEAAAKPALLSLGDVRGGALDGVDLEVAAGEVVGLTGLIGSGYAELPYFIFGAQTARAGRMRFDGTETALTAAKPHASLERGMALLPADRPHAGGVGALPVADNMMLPSLSAFFQGGFLRRGLIRARATELGADFEVRPNDPDLPLSALSGGNAQKVLLARWMSRNPKLLLLDEPTQGVDVGTRRQIFTALRAAAAQGMAVICASSDYEQLADICDRVVVFRRGRIQQTLTSPSLSKDAIADACYADTDPRDA